MTPRALIAPLALALWGVAPPSFAAPTADASRLNEGLPPGFRRPRVVVYPLLDQRVLTTPADRHVDGQVPARPAPEAWTVFLDELREARNLSVQPPGMTVRAITDDLGYRRALELAMATAERGYRDYREVRLDAAADSLLAAVDAFVELEHHIVAPREVARAALTGGLALLESDKAVLAERAFRRALLLEPTLRLRPGYDLPRAIEALEAARASLLAEGPPAPDDFSARRPGRAKRASGFVLRARALPDRLEVVIHSASGISLEVQPYGDDPTDAGSRLASRVRACLPFGRMPRPEGHRSQLFLEAGFDAYAFADNPVEAFPNVGVAVHLSWIAAPHLSLDFHGSLSNGERDPQEHLRRDIDTARLAFGPGYVWSNERLRAHAQVGLEVATMGPVIITTNPACKYFGEDDPVPDVLCDRERDIDMFDRAWFVGPMVSVGGSVRLVDQIFFALRLTGATYVFESSDNGFDVPLGGSVALGYRLF